VDAGRNAQTTTDGDVSAAGAAVATLVVSAREDLQIAREVRATLG
jgi:acetate kinase